MAKHHYSPGIRHCLQGVSLLFMGALMNGELYCSGGGPYITDTHMHFDYLNIKINFYTAISRSSSPHVWFAIRPVNRSVVLLIDAFIVMLLS